MAYTEEEIKKYLDILHNYKYERDYPPTSRGVMGGCYPSKAKCKNCPNTENFTIDWGQKICNECGVLNGHVLGLFDIKDLDYRKKVAL